MTEHAKTCRYKFIRSFVYDNASKILSYEGQKLRGAHWTYIRNREEKCIYYRARVNTEHIYVNAIIYKIEGKENANFFTDALIPALCGEKSTYQQIKKRIMKWPLKDWQRGLEKLKELTPDLWWRSEFKND